LSEDRFAKLLSSCCMPLTIRLLFYYTYFGMINISIMELQLHIKWM
jgi:hypothetical protein